jgi:hypothetical protein
VVAKRRAGLGLGVPVVGTAVDDLARTLGEGRGTVVPAEDPRALAGALSRVVAGERPDPALGLAYARQFTPSAAAAVQASAYRQLLASARAGEARRAMALKPAPSGNHVRPGLARSSDTAGWFSGRSAFTPASRRRR